MKLINKSILIYSVTPITTFQWLLHGFLKKKKKNAASTRSAFEQIWGMGWKILLTLASFALVNIRLESFPFIASS